MASRLLADLTDEMRLSAMLVEDLCRKKGVPILIYCTYRSPYEQARLYRQSRSYSEIKAKIDQLSRRGFTALAEILEGAGPQGPGPKRTGAAPGESFHQWGRAVDAVPVIDGKLEWNSRHPAWQTYGEAVREAGLTWAGDWRSFREYPHAQNSDEGNALRIYSPGDVEALLAHLPGPKR